MRLPEIAAIALIALAGPAPAVSDEIATTPIRAAHFVLAPSSVDAAAVPLEDALRILSIACDSGFNTIVVQIANGIKLDSRPELARRGAWEKDELAAFMSSASACDIEVVPEFKFLTHQEKFLQHHYPELMYNAVTYDPRKDGVYDVVFDALDELVELMQPNAISIGHDEVVGWNAAHAKKNLASGEHMLPADLYLRDVLTLHEYLQKQEIETWMWGDMLFAPAEAPQMLASYLHGASNGYGKAVRDQLPRDIVICDWHYVDRQTEFPTMSILQSEGFRVIGATWRRTETTENFSAYAEKNDAYGMMATVWFHLPLQQWDIIEQILTESARIFDSARPND